MILPSRRGSDSPICSDLNCMTLKGCGAIPSCPIKSSGLGVVDDAVQSWSRGVIQSSSTPLKSSRVVKSSSPQSLNLSSSPLFISQLLLLFFPSHTFNLSTSPLHFSTSSSLHLSTPQPLNSPNHRPLQKPNPTRSSIDLCNAPTHPPVSLLNHHLPSTFNLEAA